MSLRPPPRSEKPSRAVAKMLLLTLLAVAAGAVIWAAVTNQRIDQTESTPYGDVEIEGAASVDGLTIAVDHVGLGSLPVILLHDVDMAGSVVWDDLISELGDGVTAVKVDLPGFGWSSRIIEPGSAHTVASMAEMVSTIVEQRFNRPVVVVGAGLGGEVGAEMAVTRPDLLAGLVMIDSDFWAPESWREIGETLPFFGRPVTYALETGGQFSFENWAPKCEGGGWCPSQAQAKTRSDILSISGTTDSLHAFRLTPPASLVPSELDAITTPSVYVWSTGGSVPVSSRDRIASEIAGLQVVEVDAWKAHLDDPAGVAKTVLSLAP